MSEHLDDKSGGLKVPRVLVGVGGSIAAYRACDLVRGLRAEGFEVKVAPTRAALRFVTGLTFETLSGQVVLGEVLDVEAGTIPHIEEAYAADLVVVAPATAGLIARMAHGFADEALLATLLSYQGPLVVAPAMETRMWEHPAVAANVALLRQRGAELVGPVSGALASGRAGLGRLAPVDDIVERCVAQLSQRDLEGKVMLITAGPTVEEFDPVRFLTNRSSGKMGVAIARAAAHRGAIVHLVHGPLQVVAPPLPNLIAHPVRSAEEMAATVDNLLNGTVDAAILAAAVADYTPKERMAQKRKKSSDALSVSLVRTRDILASLGQLPPPGRPFLVGFAAETENVLENARAKRVSKGCDAICANDVSKSDRGFGTRQNRLHWIDKHGEEDLGLQTKDALAQAIVDRVAAAIGRGPHGARR